MSITTKAEWWVGAYSRIYDNRETLWTTGNRCGEIEHVDWKVGWKVYRHYHSEIRAKNIGISGEIRMKMWWL